MMIKTIHIMKYSDYKTSVSWDWLKVIFFCFVMIMSQLLKWFGLWAPPCQNQKVQISIKLKQRIKFGGREGGHLHEPLVTVNIFPWLIFIQNFGEMKFYLKIVLDFWKQGKNNTGIIFCLMEFGWKFVIHLQLKSRVEFRNF